MSGHQKGGKRSQKVSRLALGVVIHVARGLGEPREVPSTTARCSVTTSEVLRGLYALFLYYVWCFYPLSELGRPFKFTLSLVVVVPVCPRSSLRT
jgi:hypothetical protein